MKARLIGGFVCGLLVLAGCDMGLDDPANKYEQLNIETKTLLEVLRKINDEASATENLADLEDAAGKVRDIQRRINDAEEARAQKKKGGGMARITNASQAKQFQFVGDSARRQVERIRQADPKAGAIVDKAVEGIEFPDPPPEAML
jgi:hypothetical protein